MPAEEIPDGSVKTVLGSWNRSTARERAIAETLFELQDRRQLRAFLRKIRAYVTDISEEVASSLIRVIYSKAEIFSKQGRENLWNSEQDNAKYLLIALLNDRVSPKDIRGLLLEAVLGTPSLLFAVSLVLSCHQERGGPWHALFEAIDIGELRHKLAERLQEHFIDAGRNS